MAEMRAEQRTEMAEVRTEMAEVRTEIANLDTRLSTQISTAENPLDMAHARHRRARHRGASPAWLRDRPQGGRRSRPGATPRCERAALDEGPGRPEQPGSAVGRARPARGGHQQRHGPVTGGHPSPGPARRPGSAALHAADPIAMGGSMKISGTGVVVDVDRDKAVEVAKLLGFTKTRELFQFRCSRCGWHLHLHWGGRLTSTTTPTTRNPARSPSDLVPPGVRSRGRRDVAAARWPVVARTRRRGRGRLRCPAAGLAGETTQCA